jgi:hypothetical protein
LALGFFLGAFFGGEKLLRSLRFLLCLSVLARAGLWCWYWGFSARGSSSLGLAGADWRGTGDDVKGFLGEAKKDIPDRDCCEQEDDL